LTGFFYADSFTLIKKKSVLYFWILAPPHRESEFAFLLPSVIVSGVFPPPTEHIHQLASFSAPIFCHFVDKPDDIVHNFPKQIMDVHLAVPLRLRPYRGTDRFKFLGLKIQK